MKKYFITATGTDIGKTYITAALTEKLRRIGKTVTALKPVISGFDAGAIAQSDTGILLKAQGLPLTKPETISPWHFRAPISPDMAAEDEGKQIDFPRLISFCRQQKETDYLLIEGPGGAMTPISRTHNVLDWMAELDYNTILITGSYLGAISHTLTAFEAIVSRKIPLHSLIINESVVSPVPMERILLTIKHFLPNNLPVHCVTRQDQTETLKNISL